MSSKTIISACWSLMLLTMSRWSFPGGNFLGEKFSQQEIFIVWDFHRGEFSGRNFSGGKDFSVPPWQNQLLGMFVNFIVLDNSILTKTGLITQNTWINLSMKCSFRSLYILDSNPATLIKWLQYRPIPGKDLTISKHSRGNIFLGICFCQSQKFWSVGLSF